MKLLSSNKNIMFQYIAPAFFTFANTINSTPALTGQSTKATCTYSEVVGTRVEGDYSTKYNVKIDSKCEVNLSKNIIVIKWGNNEGIQIEGDWNSGLNQRQQAGEAGAKNLKINGKSESVFIYHPSKPNSEYCFQYNNERKNICFKALSKKPKLIPGNYLVGDSGTRSGFSIYKKNDRFCKASFSKHYSSIVSSLRESSTSPNTFVIEYIGQFLYMNNSKTLSSEGNNYRYVDQLGSSIPPEVKKCLDSNSSFFYYEK
jgi:hypothetical protein